LDLGLNRAVNIMIFNYILSQTLIVFSDLLYSINL
jgi:hypothetical protein